MCCVVFWVGCVSVGLCVCCVCVVLVLCCSVLGGFVVLVCLFCLVVLLFWFVCVFCC